MPMGIWSWLQGKFASFFQASQVIHSFTSQQPVSCFAIILNGYKRMCLFLLKLLGV